MSSDASIKVYGTSISSNSNVATQQNHIETVLTSKKLPFKFIDISSDMTGGLKDEMRDKANKPDALPPQIFNGDVYCGDYPAFQEAVEEERVLEFLHVQQ